MKSRRAPFPLLFFPSSHCCVFLVLPRTVRGAAVTSGDVTSVHRRPTRHTDGEGDVAAAIRSSAIVLNGDSGGLLVDDLATTHPVCCAVL